MSVFQKSALAQPWAVPACSSASALPDTVARAVEAGEAAIVITGPPQSGKSALLAKAAAVLARDNVRVVRLESPDGGPLSLLRIVAQVVGPGSDDLTTTRLEQFYRKLAERQGREKRVVLAIDDAHRLTRPAWNSLELLASRVPAGSLQVQLVMTGLPELWDRFPTEGILHLARVSTRLVLPPRNVRPVGNEDLRPTLPAAPKLAQGADLVFFSEPGAAVPARQRRTLALAVPPGMTAGRARFGLGAALAFAAVVACSAWWARHAGNVADPVAEAQAATAPVAPARAAHPPPPGLPPEPAAVAEPTVAASDPALAVLFARGNALLATGDVAGARLVFERAAAGGSARAAAAAAMTFDPRFLSAIGAKGIAADPSLALGWYRRAAALGSPEAAQLAAPLEATAGRVAPGLAR